MEARSFVKKTGEKGRLFNRGAKKKCSTELSLTLCFLRLF
jgi:hypothetical protein